MVQPICVGILDDREFTALRKDGKDAKSKETKDGKCKSQAFYMHLPYPLRFNHIPYPSNFVLRSKPSNPVSLPRPSRPPPPPLHPPKLAPAAFAADILLACGPDLFAPWAFDVSSQLAAGVSYHPLLSGYYR